MNNSNISRTVRVETNPTVKINFTNEQWFAVKNGELLGTYKSLKEAVYAIRPSKEDQI